MDLLWSALCYEPQTGNTAAAVSAWLPVLQIAEKCVAHLQAAQAATEQGVLFMLLIAFCDIKVQSHVVHVVVEFEVEYI